MTPRGHDERPSRRYVPPPAPVEVRGDALFEGLTDAEALLLPTRLYVAGRQALAFAPRRVAIVGTRTPSPAGLARARRLARELAAAGVVVVSGLARGIDAAAHEGAIGAGGDTIAVIGTPLQTVYPAEHAALQTEIYTKHLLVSQLPPGARVHGGSFLARNRTMARLAQASVVVEAGATSGSVNQAMETLRLGRPLFLLRSLVEAPGLDWPEALLARGARVLSSSAELLESLWPSTDSGPSRSSPTAPPPPTPPTPRIGP